MTHFSGYGIAMLVIFLLFMVILPYLWPLLLVLAVMSGVSLLRTKRMIERSRADAERMYRQGQDLKAPAGKSADVIDAEFEERESEEQKI